MEYICRLKILILHSPRTNSNLRMELMVFDASDLHHGTHVTLRTNLAVNIAHLGIGSCQNQLKQYKNI